MLTSREVYANWAHGKDCDPEAGAIGLRQALETYLAQGNKSGAPSFYGLLAELEAMRPDVDGALAAIDAGFAIAEETGEHYTDPYLHRLRGEFLLMQWPDAPVSGRGSLPNRYRHCEGTGRAGVCPLASHSLAKLYQSTGRPADARAILAPALEGFSPTQEML